MQQEHTIREDETQVQPEITKVETKSRAGNTTPNLREFRGYRVIKEFPAKGGEADTYLIEKEGKKFFLKLYRSGVVPKESVLRKTYELSRKMQDYVVFTFEYGFDKKLNRWFEVQEYVKFGNLLDFVKSKNLYSNSDFVREVVKELSECIHALHTQGIIHRDLKPTNILVRSGQPLNLVLTDFGISSLLEEDVSKVFSTVKGTYAYSAPESFSGYFGREVDWWALGVIVLELLTGKNPLSGLAPQVIMHTLSTKGLEVPETLNDEWKLLLKGLFTKDPKKRWGYEQVQRWLKGEIDIPVYYQGDTKEASIDKWIKHGFTEKGAEKWKEVVNDPEIAKDFKKQGFTPEEAKPWINAGFVNASSVKSWINAGYSEPNVVRIYEDYGVGPAFARKLESAGVDYKTFLYACKNHSIQPKTLLDLAEWLKNKNKARKKNINIGVFVRYYADLRNYTNNLDKIYEVVELGVNIKDLIKTLESSMHEITGKYKLSSEELLGVVAYTLKYNSINKENNISVEKLTEYFVNLKSKGISNLKQVFEFYNNDVKATQVEAVIQICNEILDGKINRQNIKKSKELLDKGISSEVIKEWKSLLLGKYRLNLDNKSLLDIIVLCKAKGIDVDKFEEWLLFTGWRRNYIELIELIDKCSSIGCDASQVRNFVKANQLPVNNLDIIAKEVIKYNKMLGLSLYNNMPVYILLSGVIYVIAYIIPNSKDFWSFVGHSLLGVVILLVVFLVYYHIAFRFITVKVLGNFAYYVLRKGILVRAFTAVSMLIVITFLNFILSGFLIEKNKDAGTLFFLVSTAMLLAFTIFMLVHKRLATKH